MSSRSSVGRARDFWAQLTEDERRGIAHASQAVRFSQGGHLFRQGEMSTHMVVIRAGSVKVTCTSPAGGETVLSICGPGELVGEVAAVTGGPRSATVTALNQVDGLVFSSAKFAAMARANPRLRLLLERVLAARLLHADRRRAEAGTPLAMPRIAAVLADLAEQHTPADGIGRGIALPVSQAELASLAATSASSTARALRDLRNRGLVRTTRRMITVVDVAELRRYADRLIAG